MTSPLVEEARRVTLWVCDECDYWRSDKNTGRHTLENPADPNGQMLTHRLHPMEFVPLPAYEDRSKAFEDAAADCVRLEELREAAVEIAQYWPGSRTKKNYAPWLLRFLKAVDALSSAEAEAEQHAHAEHLREAREHRSPEFEAAMRQWKERGGLTYGPPPLPPCPYCHSYDYGCELGGCRAPKSSSEVEQHQEEKHGE